MNVYLIYKIIIGIAVLIYTLVFSLTALIPIRTFEGKSKNVSSIMWLTPIIGVVLITIFGKITSEVWFWEDEYQMSYYFYFIIATVILCIGINQALGEFSSYIDEDGIHTRRFVGGYRIIPYELIKVNAKILQPFCYKNYLYIYMGKSHIAFEIGTSFGGKHFLNKLSEKAGYSFCYFEDQMKGDQVQNFRWYCLMMNLEKAEKKRLRQENRNRE